MTCLKLCGDLPFHNLDGPLLAAALLITLVWKHKKGKIFGRSVIILIIQGAEVSANTRSITMIIIHGAEESAAGRSVIMIYLIYCSGSRHPMPPTQSLRMTQVRMIASWHLLVLRAPAHLWRPNMCWMPSERGVVKVMNSPLLSFQFCMFENQFEKPGCPWERSTSQWSLWFVLSSQVLQV